MMLIGTVEWETVSLTADFIIKQSSVAPRFNARLEYTLVLWRSVQIPNPIKQTINPPIKFIFFFCLINFHRQMNFFFKNNSWEEQRVEISQEKSYTTPRLESKILYPRDH